jgi:hypothetical protein
MFYSAEARWFFPGDLPDKMVAWFERGSLGVSSPERTDEYLLLPGVSTTSVKLREGRFEVKVITGELEEVAWSDKIVCAQDTWVKWSRKLSDPGALRELTAGDDARWIRIAKQRDLRLISLDNEEAVEIEPNTIRLSNGCQFELTRINLLDSDAGDLWWSFSFEAFGKPGSIVENLKRGTSHVLGAPPPLPLPKAQSMSYPQWLNTCTQH